MLDIRMPIGAMFLIMGLLLGLYGMGQSGAVLAPSLGYNVNMLWGGVMALFGLVMFAWMKLDPYNAG